MLKGPVAGEVGANASPRNLHKGLRYLWGTLSSHLSLELECYTNMSDVYTAAVTKARLQKKAKCSWEGSYPEVERSLGKSTGLQGQRVRGDSYPEPNIFLMLKTFLSATLILCTFGEEMLCVYELNELHFQEC